MIAVFCLALIVIIVQSFGRFGVLFFPRNLAQESELDKHLALRGYNLQRLMADVSSLSDQMFGRGGFGSFVRINIVLYFFYLAILCAYALWIAGPTLLLSFVRNGQTIAVDQTERDFLLQVWPGYVHRLVDNGGRLYVGDALLATLAIVAILLIALSATSSVSVLVNLRLIRWMGAARRRFVSSAPRMAAAFGLSLVCDLLFPIMVVTTILIAGRGLGVSLEEEFKAQIQDGALTYGFALVRDYGGSDRSSISLGVGLKVTGVDFNQLVWDVPEDRVIDRVMSYGLLLDAGALCDRYQIRSTCRDRLRSLFFQHFRPTPGSYAPAFSNLLFYASMAACGHDPWSALLGMGPGGSASVRLVLPLFASLGALFLAKALVVPVLIAIAVMDAAIVGIARYAARSSERNFMMVSLNAVALFGAPPVMAVTVMWFLVRWGVCS